MAMKVFIYENDFRLGHGHFASVDGFKLREYEGHKHLEAVRDEKGRIYGTVYEMDKMSLGFMDAYYGVGVLHERITVTATLQGGQEIKVEMYEFTHAELV
jgi:gamma-glutamylcyclotransferase (GGCT)/AIG2-like uncharacterized protein YtfP